MECMKLEIIPGAGQEGLITSDFDGTPQKIAGKKAETRSEAPEPEGSESAEA